MALSEPDVQNTVPDISIVGQDYLACGTEDCKRSCKFYCNPCHRPLCEECRNGHHDDPNTKNHDVVPYIKRKRKLPEEKCKDHPTKNIDMLCEDCQVPVCSKCATQNHRKHALNDLETIYSERFTFCLDKIYEVNQYFIPTSQDTQINIKEDLKKLKSTMDNVRTSLKTEAESFKRLVDTVTSDNIEHVNKIEESLMEELQSQDKTYQDYISYLEDLVNQFIGYLSSNKLQNNPLFLSLSDKLKIQHIPKTTKPFFPVFTAGQYSKEDVTKLLGRVNVPDTKPENRDTKPIETASTQYNIHNFSIYLISLLLLFFLIIPDLYIDNHIEKLRKQDGGKSDVILKPTLSLSSSVTKVREYTVPGVDSVWHISLGKSGRLWVSDDKGNLFQTDLEGNQLQKIQTSGGSEGYHTVTQDGGLMYTDRENKVIKRITQNNTITTFIKTGDWEPISIHSSHINGDILVGMIKNKEAKVTRYNKKGEEIQNIQRDNKGQELYIHPRYITENINGDICTSDHYKEAVVVVNKSGQHRFSYTGQGSRFWPSGLCTDLLGHILVTDVNIKAVYFLDQDGQFLSLLRTQQRGIIRSIDLCVDDEYNLHMGQLGTNTVTVHKYLQ